jgi:ribosomal protein S19
MNRFYLSLIFSFLAACTLAQFNATITVTDLGTGAPLQNATVLLDGNFQSTDAAGQAVFVGLADANYNYAVTAACYTPGTGSVTIAGADADAALALEEQNVNNVFFFVGSPMQIMGATVTLYDGANYNESFVTSDPWGDMLADVPYGEYSYSITIPCYAPVSGTVTVECNNGDGIGVFAEPVQATANNVFFFVGSPMQIMGATVTLYDGADYNESFVTSDPWGDMLADVPYGEYSYSITIPCYAPVSGTVTVACNNGDGIGVFAEPVQATANNVFFFVGSPMQIMGATVTLYDGANYNESFVTSDPWGDMLADVPYGEYSYSITIPCYAPVSGTVTVACNNGDGIAVFAEPVQATANNVFFFVGSPMQIMGATVTLYDGANYNESFVTSDPWGDMLADVPYGEYSYSITIPCYAPVSGTVVVECNNGDGIAVFAEPTGIIIDLTVTLDGSVLTAAAPGLAYQWVDCDNANAFIDGAIVQSFAPTVNGNYAVIITDGDCSQTSSCTAVTTTGTADIEGRDAFAVYPNPCTDMVTVRTNVETGNVRLELFNAAGQMIVGETRRGMELITVQTAHLPAGSYMLRLTTEHVSTIRNLVVAPR